MKSQQELNLNSHRGAEFDTRAISNPFRKTARFMEIYAYTLQCNITIDVKKKRGGGGTSRTAEHISLSLRMVMNMHGLFAVSLSKSINNALSQSYYKFEGA